MKIAIIGSRGIPAQYGGFETLAEYLVKYLSDEFEITVFCSKKLRQNNISEYNGCKLKYIPFNANGWQSIPYDIISILLSYQSFDKILMLGVSGSIVLPFLNQYRNKFILNFGGLDWKRSKWSIFTRKYLKWLEEIGIKYSEHLISDNIGIQDYILKKYDRSSELIAYGGNQVYKVNPNSLDYVNYPFLKNNYAFSVARIQQDNNIDLLLESFNNNSSFPIVLAGNWGESSYGIKTKKKYINRSNIILLDAIYDKRELNLLRSNCKVYLHGHSAGGTNPALVEAMNLSLPILAFDNIFNKHTTRYQAEYFSSSAELHKKLSTISDKALREIGREMYSVAKELYQWEYIAKLYSKIFKK